MEGPTDEVKDRRLEVFWQHFEWLMREPNETDEQLCSRLGMTSDNLTDLKRGKMDQVPLGVVISLCHRIGWRVEHFRVEFEKLFSQLSSAYGVMVYLADNAPESDRPDKPDQVDMACLVKFTLSNMLDSIENLDKSLPGESRL